MTLDTLLMLVGALIAVLPFLGVPRSWDTPLFFALGVLVIVLGIVVRNRLGDSEYESHSYSESSPSSHEEEGR